MRLPSLVPLAVTPVIALLLLGGTSGCEKHPADEPAQGYGHGSAHRDAKGGESHGPDGTNVRFSDSQGTDVRTPEKEHGESETHASGPEHGRPGPGGQHDPEHK